ncbi:MAG: glycerophosphodiester phosphodiesterase family protein [Paracoccaceae bacterium]
MTALPSDFLTIPLAHRGYYDVASGCPENSIAAFGAAIENGYGMELDVQISADGRAMVFHDYDLARLTGNQGVVQQHSAHALGELTLLGSDEKIQTLENVLKAVAGRAPLLIEIKDQDGALGANVGALEKAVAKALNAYQGPVAVISFNPHSVIAFAEYAPDTPRGLATGDFSENIWPQIPEETRNRLRDIPDLKRSGASFISHKVSDLERPLVQSIKASGMPVLCWTVTSQEVEDTARRCADNITFEGYRAQVVST